MTRPMTRPRLTPRSVLLSICLPASRSIRLPPCQTLINELPTTLSEELDFGDSVGFSQMSDHWKVDKLCKCLASNRSVKRLNLAGNGLKDAFAARSSWLGL